MRPTREGISVLLLALLLFFVAFNTGFNLLYLMGALMAGLFVANLVVLLTIRVPRLRRITGPPRAERGRVFELILHFDAFSLVSRVLRPVCSVELHGTSKQHPKPHQLAQVTFTVGKRQRVPWRLVIDERGIYENLRAVTRITFPFGFLVKSRNFDASIAIVVGPKTVSLPEVRFTAADGFEENHVHRWARRGLGGRVYGVREGDDWTPSRNIHWGQTARLGRIVAIEREQDPAARAVVLVMPRVGQSADWEREFEGHLDVTSSILRDLAKQQVVVSLLGFLPEMARTRFGSEHELLDEMYRMLADASLPEVLPEGQVIDQIVRLVPRQTSVILAAGRSTSQVRAFHRQLLLHNLSVNLAAPDSPTDSTSGHWTAEEIASHRRASARAATTSEVG